MFTASRVSLERIAALDRAVRAGEYPNARALAARLEVGHRTVQRDIEFLRDRVGAPLAYDPVRHGYYYTDPTFRRPPLELTEGELVALFLAGRVLREYRGTPYRPDLERAFRKVAAGLSDRVTIDPGHLEAAYSFRTTAPAGFEVDYFRVLAGALLHRHRVELRYYSASRDEETHRAVDPYHLACVDGQWYLIGFCHLRSEVRMFHPGRIRALEVTEVSFDVPAEFRVGEYLARSFAVLRGSAGELFRVRLRFTGEAVRYVRERTWHPTQTVETAPRGDLIIGLEVSHLREVERWALSWGADCEVLGPPELRDRVAAESARAAARFGRRGDEGEPTDQTGPPGPRGRRRPADGGRESRSDPR